MAGKKGIDKLCLAVTALTLVLTLLLMCGGSLGLRAAARTVKYETTLFDSTRVHQIDLVMDDWEGFIANCENEEYASCTVVVDGKKHANVGIRAKGNTSLSSVRSMGSQRYSFKLEFDHYETGKSLDGLDKLCLNNLIQDNTMMKDFLVYQMMGDFGVNSPLCAFAYLSVNGADWGLYLAVEGVEDSFLARNYGSEPGELYKPDSVSFGGGRGNGKAFDPAAMNRSEDEERQSQGGFPEGRTPEENAPFGGAQQGGPGGAQQGGPGGAIPGGPVAEGGAGVPNAAEQSGRGGMPGGGMGSEDVKLKYVDDDPASYPNIFGSAKTEISTADQKRLIAALKQLGSDSDPEQVLEPEELLRYFVVHNFVCNGDSYTGSMIHNYYLHEKDGRLGMIPWDYNLAFGAFQGGSAASEINASIDNPVSGSLEDRPMLRWIFASQSCTEQYHSLFAEFLARWDSDGELEELIARTAELIRPWVERDPTKFCTAEDFETGVAALRRFVSLRAEAVRRQLAGDDSPVDPGDLALSDLGTMGGRGGGAEGGAPGGPEGQNPPAAPQDGSLPAPPEAAAGSEGAPAGENGGFGGPGGLPGQIQGNPAARNTEERGTADGRGEGPGPRQGAAGERGASPSGGGADPAAAESASPDGSASWILVGVSVLVLGLGLAVAIKKY